MQQVAVQVANVTTCHLDCVFAFQEASYVCRVARRLFAADPDRAFGDPWDMTAADLKELIGRFLNKWRPLPALPDVVVGLLRAIELDPTRCPILADAVEEAGCTDQSFLEALRS